MGILNDLYQRNKVREDNADIQARIKLARKWLFKDSVPLTSVWLKRTLKPMSLTPTRVSAPGFTIDRADASYDYIERVLDLRLSTDLIR